MTVYREPREAPDGVCSRAGADPLTPAPNITVNKPVCSARLASLPCSPGSPLPETTMARTSPGPVMRAWDGPFAKAGVARVTAAAMLMPAARAATAVSLRSMAAPSVAPHPCYTATPCQVPARARAVPVPARVSARRAGDGERGRLGEAAFQAQRDLPGAPDQGVAGGEPGRGRGRCAVAGDVHQHVRALDPQALAAVHPDLGHVAEMNELLEEDRVEVAGELIHPDLAVRRPAVDQGGDPPAVADHDLAGPAEGRRHQDGEGDVAAGLRQRHPPLAGQGGAAPRGRRRARLLLQLDAGESQDMGDHRPALRGRDQEGDQDGHHHQRGTPGRPPAAKDPRPPPGRVGAPGRGAFQPLPDGRGEAGGGRHVKLAAEVPQLGLHGALPPSLVSHGTPRPARPPGARAACSAPGTCATSPTRAATPARAPSPPRTGRGSTGTPAPAAPGPGARLRRPPAGCAVPRPAPPRPGHPP